MNEHHGPVLDVEAYRRAVKAELARRTLMGFTQWTMPTYKAGWFHREIAAELDQFLDDVVAMKSPRLILQAPPRSGKTEIVSRRFPAYALGKHPDLSFIATSYAADLSSRTNRDVQRIIEEPRYEDLFPGTRLNASNIRTVAQGTWLRNSDIFEVVGKQGVYRSAGVCGGITGMGAHVLLIDDPIKDDIEANSEVYRARVWNWYTSTAYTRLAPGGGVLVIMTRWHEDDLVGRLIRAMEHGEAVVEGEKVDKWRVIRYPAVAEDDEKHRKKGEALHPERYPIDQLQRIKTAVGSRVWISLYQQRPTAAEGSVLKREHWRSFQMPDGLDVKETLAALGVRQVIQAWDTGFKKGAENDPSAGITLGVCANRYLILDLWCRRVEYPELKRAVVAQHAKWNPSVVVVEDAASGQSLIQELRRETRLPIYPFRPDRDKLARVNAITPSMEAGLVCVPTSAAWLSDFIEECSAFPNGAHDDQVDAFSMALGYATNGGGGLGIFNWMRLQSEAHMAKQEEVRAAQR